MSIANPILVPPRSITTALRKREDDLVVLPAVANEALAVVQDPNCTAAEFGAIVNRDLKLAAEILTLANSPVYAGGNPVTNLAQATVRLGFRQCRNLILASCCASIMKRLSVNQASVREALWRHSFLTATTCVNLNRFFNLGFQGEEFAAGLLHDFGRLLLAIASQERFVQIDPLDFKADDEQIMREQTAVNFDHCELGAWFAQKNHFPDEIISTIRFHHTPAKRHPNQLLFSLVAAGDHIANFLHDSANPGDYDATTNAGLQELRKLHPAIGRISSFQDHSAQILARIIQETNQSL